ncbi:uncharacterized protein LOC100837915 [Brachypodium distachyon]|uniref:Uncharacterized protein n=1 Tax=Brachypodium distachyon TaxID=15368 RepID=A0A0Q3HVM6_BRADI|nr:uncharacterized protein LOC100837915 [Brachypodium distachyon]KQJ92306.1 hypothetical protein BRADI_4g42770v3 [Brachypodium distachyon]KQJ92307.1 hypothetical protein BRADI_4g42770v3 [Brachypodium distachyon]|eukprot:XP_024311143.1 uncharacterized protein LOC100837915 [Brachypodium distachyon]
MYIRCEKCRNWSHGDALGLEEARLGEVIYYRCCRCRRKARCPHSDDYHPKRSEAEPISQENAAGILSSAEAVGAAGDNSSYASFGRVENPVEETVDAYSPVDTESFVPESNEDINFVDGSSHSTHPFDKEEIKQVMKDVRPHDACFSWHTPGNGSCRPLDSVDGFPPPAPTVETNLDKNQTVILQRAFDSFRVIAAETGSLYERLRERDLLTNDEIMGTLDMLQEIALHRMQDIACCQVDDIIYPEVTEQPMHNANTTTTTRPSDDESSSRTSAPDA